MTALSRTILMAFALVGLALVAMPATSSAADYGTYASPTQGGGYAAAAGGYCVDRGIMVCRYTSAGQLCKRSEGPQEARRQMRTCLRQVGVYTNAITHSCVFTNGGVCLRNNNTGACDANWSTSQGIRSCRNLHAARGIN